MGLAQFEIMYVKGGEITELKDFDHDNFNKNILWDSIFNLTLIFCG